jgi:alkylhydroperoxidase family enzyme
MASTNHGCRYCQAHTSHSAHNNGISDQKIAALYEFETNPLFDDAERAARRFARDAALQPNATTSDHCKQLPAHYSEEQIVELMATIATFGFLNRWNDTMPPELEDEPLEFARQHLTDAGWEAGKHQ